MVLDLSSNIIGLDPEGSGYSATDSFSLVAINHGNGGQIDFINGDTG